MAVGRKSKNEFSVFVPESSSAVSPSFTSWRALQSNKSQTMRDEGEVVDRMTMFAKRLGC